MSMPSGWLPNPVALSDFRGDWFAYFEAIYKVYLDDFVYDQPLFRGRKVRTIVEPMREGKEESFWHVVQGKSSTNSEQDMNRCARIPWIRPMIEAAGQGQLKCWSVRRSTQGKRRAQPRIVIALDDFSYVVVLLDMKKSPLLFTAYYVDQPHQRVKLADEFRRNGPY
jgi:hypothetical protein